MKGISNLLIAGILIFVFVFGLYQVFLSIRNFPEEDIMTGFSVQDEKCGLRLQGQASITPEQINEVLKKHDSPVYGKGKFIYDKGLEYGIDPVFALAWFAKESTYAKSPEVIARTTHSIGNIIYHKGCSFNHKGFCGYNTWEDGVVGWYRQIDLDIKRGLDTVEKLLPKYCPVEDKCNTLGYIEFVRDYVKKYKDVSCFGLTKEEKDTLKKSYQKTSSLMGTYFVNPSFSFEVKNPFNDYKELGEFVKNIEDNCYNDPLIDPIECIKEQGNKNPQLELTLGICGDDKEVIFESFKENYYDCLNSNDNDCVCEFSLNSGEANTRKGEYKIKICNKEGKECKGSYIKLEEPENQISAFDMKTPINIEDELRNEEKEYLDYFVRYNDDGSFKEAKLGIMGVGKDETFDYDTVRLYKDNDRLVLIKENKGKRQCILSKKTYRFCAVNKNNKGAMPIRFALHINDIPPPIIKGLKVISNKKHDNSIILTWKESSAMDVVMYSVYYSLYDFSNANIKSHKLEYSQPYSAIEFKIGDARNYNDIKLEPICRFDKNDNICIYEYIAKKENSDVFIRLEPDKLYYDKAEGRYLSVINNLENKNYYFAVTAIDKHDNEINNNDKEQKFLLGENINTLIPLDELAPGVVRLSKPKIMSMEGRKYLELEWETPINNIDGSRDSKNDINEYRVYYELSDFSSALSLKEKLTTKSNDVLIPLSEFQNAKEYYFGVVAIDKLGNLHEENVLTEFVVID